MIIERSFITINKNNLIQNFINIKSKLLPGEKPACVIKANAYGHGDIELALLYQELGVDFFCVACLDEAIKIRKVLKPNTSILILGYTPYEFTDKLIEYNLIQTITSKDYLNNLYKYSNNKIKVHIAIDTGMSRIGLQNNDEIDKVINFALDKYNVDGIYTHMSVADSLNDIHNTHTKNQKEIIKSLYNKYKNIIPHFHYKNSASIIRQLESIGNMVRPGIILYGLNPSDDVKEYIDLKPVIEWKSIISSIRTIKPGETVGYGNTYKADKKTKIATISTGYADGYNRLLSNKGSVIINGKLAPIVGRVCMDQFMVDITNIDNVEINTLATLIGKENDVEITVDDLAKLCATINYEIVCDISNRVKKFYI